MPSHQYTDKWNKIMPFFDTFHFTTFTLLTLFVKDKYIYQCTLFYIKNDAEILSALYTWKVAEKGFKMAFIMNKLAMINSCEIILEK
jgi:hypothetical protein